VGEDKGFGLWANSGGVSTASRAMPSAMQVGDVFSIRFDNNWIDNGGSTGIALTNASGSSRVRFYFNGGETNYRIDDSTIGRDTGIPYTSDGLLLEFTVTSANAYRLKVGGSTINGSLTGSGDITGFVVTNQNAGPNTERNLYLGAMSFVRTVDLSGSTSIDAPIITVLADGGGGGGGGETVLRPFRVTSIEVNGDQCHLVWQSQAGTTYTVEATDALDDPTSWTQIESGIESSGDGVMSAIIDLSSMQAAGSSKLFLRVKAEAVVD
jgi:hypothetical protein